MKDYRVKVTIRNERLLSVMEEKGHESVAAFCKAYKLSAPFVRDVINGRKPPLDRNKEILPTVKELLDILSLTVEQAFTPRQLQGFRKNTFEVKVEEKQLKQLVNPVRNHEMLMMEKDPSHTLNVMLGELNPREEKIVRMLHGIGMKSDHTLAEVGLMFKVTSSAIGAIHKRALRKLSHIQNLKKLQDAGADDVYGKLDLSGTKTAAVREVERLNAMLIKEEKIREADTNETQ